MESERSKTLRPHSATSTNDQSEANESQTVPPSPKTAWKQFYRSQYDRLSRIAANMGVPQDQIADLVQEVWLGALEHLKGSQEEDMEQRLTAWLDSVVRNKSRDVLRRLRRRREESLDDLPAERMDPKTNEPWELIEGKERYEHLGSQLEELRKENLLNCRLVCEHFLEGRPLGDLAAETGLGVHAISCRISRTLKWLRRRLRK
jgi:RNA polymerase sigma factor (sigma-70 family)